MASDNEASCVNDPNFAVICSFLECFGKSCGVEYPDIAQLQEMLENTQEVSQPLIDLHIKLLRKTRKSVTAEKWEKALVKFCHTYSNQDGWELERFGYKKARIGVKLQILKVLLEAQFDFNQKFKNEVNKLTANELRLEPLGKDKTGLSYWCQLDEECNIRVYREDLDEENWELVVKDREGMLNLISTLSNGEVIPLNEDSNSLETVEKPTIDTGQDATSEEQPVVDDEVQKASISEKIDDNIPESEDSNPKSDLHKSNEDTKSLETSNELPFKKSTEFLKKDNKKGTLNDQFPKAESTFADTRVIEPENLNKSYKSEVNKNSEEFRAIETPVITTSPLKLNLEVNKSEDKLSKPLVEETTDSLMKSLEKLSGKSSLPDSTILHSKSIKPIDQLAANLVRLQSEKLEKPTKSLEKIAENLAKSNQVTLNNGEDLPQDYCARSSEKSLRSRRGIDLSTSPRGWDMANDHNKPVDFSGKTSKSSDLSNYRSQDFQHKEMDLSTKKTKPEVPIAYDARAVMMRNHAMVADLSKRQMTFTNYDMSAAYHSSGRTPGKEEHRLPSYSIVHDPSKLAAMRMGTGSMKRTLDQEISQVEIMKRFRADVIPIRSSEKRPGFNPEWREGVGEAIEEPLMMVQGEGSGSDCDTVNPIIEDAIEEATLYFYGEGSGVDCDTGNPGDESPDNADSNKSMNEGCSSVTNDLPANNILPSSNISEVFHSGVELNRNFSQDGGTFQPKFKPTLGVQIISKSSNLPLKRISRWDVGGPEQVESSGISNKEDISKGNESIDETNYVNVVNASGIVTGNDLDVNLNSGLNLEESETRNDENVYSKIVENTKDCKDRSSPPRFFFGPNCISYSSKDTRDELDRAIFEENLSFGKEEKKEKEVETYGENFDISKDNNNLDESIEKIDEEAEEVCETLTPVSIVDNETLERNESVENEEVLENEESQKDKEKSEEACVYQELEQFGNSKISSVISDFSMKEVIPERENFKEISPLTGRDINMLENVKLSSNWESVQENVREEDEKEDGNEKEIYVESECRSDNILENVEYSEQLNSNQEKNLKAESSEKIIPIFQEPELRDFEDEENAYSASEGSENATCDTIENFEVTDLKKTLDSKITNDSNTYKIEESVVSESDKIESQMLPECSKTNFEKDSSFKIQDQKNCSAVFQDFTEDPGVEDLKNNVTKYVKSTRTIDSDIPLLGNCDENKERSKRDFPENSEKFNLVIKPEGSKSDERLNNKNMDFHEGERKLEEMKMEDELETAENIELSEETATLEETESDKNEVNLEVKYLKERSRNDQNLEKTTYAEEKNAVNIKIVELRSEDTSDQAVFFQNTNGEYSQGLKDTSLVRTSPEVKPLEPEKQNLKDDIEDFCASENLSLGTEKESKEPLETEKQRSELEVENFSKPETLGLETKKELSELGIKDIDKSETFRVETEKERLELNVEELSEPEALCLESEKQCSELDVEDLKEPEILSVETAKELSELNVEDSSEPEILSFETKKQCSEFDIKDCNEPETSSLETDKQRRELDAEDLREPEPLSLGTEKLYSKSKVEDVNEPDIFKLEIEEQRSEHSAKDFSKSETVSFEAEKESIKSHVTKEEYSDLDIEDSNDSGTPSLGIEEESIESLETESHHADLAIEDSSESKTFSLEADDKSLKPHVIEKEYSDLDIEDSNEPGTPSLGIEKESIKSLITEKQDSDFDIKDSSELESSSLEAEKEVIKSLVTEKLHSDADIEDLSESESFSLEAEKESMKPFVTEKHHSDLDVKNCSEPESSSLEAEKECIKPLVIEKQLPDLDIEDSREPRTSSFEIKKENFTRLESAEQRSELDVENLNESEIFSLESKKECLNPLETGKQSSDFVIEESSKPETSSLEIDKHSVKQLETEEQRSEHDNGDSIEPERLSFETERESIKPFETGKQSPELDRDFNESKDFSFETERESIKLFETDEQPAHVNVEDFSGTRTASLELMKESGEPFESEKLHSDADIEDLSESESFSLEAEKESMKPIVTGKQRLEHNVKDYTEPETFSLEPETFSLEPENESAKPLETGTQRLEFTAEDFSEPGALNLEIKKQRSEPNFEKLSESERLSSKIIKEIIMPLEPEKQNLEDDIEDFCVSESSSLGTEKESIEPLETEKELSELDVEDSSEPGTLNLETEKECIKPIEPEVSSVPESSEEQEANLKSIISVSSLNSGDLNVSAISESSQEKKNEILCPQNLENVDMKKQINSEVVPEVILGNLNTNEKAEFLQEKINFKLANFVPSGDAEVSHVSKTDSAISTHTAIENKSLVENYESDEEIKSDNDYGEDNFESYYPQNLCEEQEDDEVETVNEGTYVEKEKALSNYVEAKSKIDDVNKKNVLGMSESSISKETNFEGPKSIQETANVLAEGNKIEGLEEIERSNEIELEKNIVKENTVSESEPEPEHISILQPIKTSDEINVFVNREGLSDFENVGNLCSRVENPIPAKDVTNINTEDQETLMDFRKTEIICNRVEKTVCESIDMADDSEDQEAFIASGKVDELCNEIENTLFEKSDTEKMESFIETEKSKIICNITGSKRTTQIIEICSQSEKREIVFESNAEEVEEHAKIGKLPENKDVSTIENVTETKEAFENEDVRGIKGNLDSMPLKENEEMSKTHQNEQRSNEPEELSLQNTSYNQDMQKPSGRKSHSLHDEGDICLEDSSPIIQPSKRRKEDMDDPSYELSLIKTKEFTEISKKEVSSPQNLRNYSISGFKADQALSSDKTVYSEKNSDCFIEDLTIGKSKDVVEEKAGKLEAITQEVVCNKAITSEVSSKKVLERTELRREVNKRSGIGSDSEDSPPAKLKPPSEEERIATGENVKSFNSETINTGSEDIKKVEGSTSVEDIKASENVKVADACKSLKDLETTVSEEQKVEAKIQKVDVNTVTVESDNSMPFDSENTVNPLEESDSFIAKKESLKIHSAESPSKKIFGSSTKKSPIHRMSIRVKSFTELTGREVNSPELPKASRKRRKTGIKVNSEDTKNTEDDEKQDGKRMRLRGRRVPDMQLRKSVEESRVIAISSEDETAKSSTPMRPVPEENKESNDDEVVIESEVSISKKPRGRPRGKKKRGGFRGRHKSSILGQSSQEIVDPESTEPEPEIVNEKSEKTKSAQDKSQNAEESEVLNITIPTSKTAESTPDSKKKRKKRKMVLGLMIGRDMPDSESVANDEMPVRQSRRIAQLKIKEEADKRRIEDETLKCKKGEDSPDKKKRKKQKQESEEELVIIKEIEKEIKSKKKRKKKRRKKDRKFNESKPWQSSTDSSSDEENEPEEEEEEEEIESDGSLVFKSDHEFSPESDLEKDSEAEPLRRARTARKSQSDVEEADDEYACQKCGKADHPEWILLCDGCDKGWHCSCLRPALMIIPEGDWFCPPCQHTSLVMKLQQRLKDFDSLSKRHENEVLRKKRLAYVGISLDNVLQKGDGSKASSQESDESSSSTGSESSSGNSSSEESEPVYQLRERRCANTYKFNEYDDMINAAIQDEVEAVQGAGNQGRGKDIATIVNAEKEEAEAEAMALKQQMEEEDGNQEKSEKESDEEYRGEKDDYEEADQVEKKKIAVRKKLARKKHRKLNSLDISSEDDDPYSDEDFKGSSSDEEEEFDDRNSSSDESYSSTRRKGRRGEKRPVRRSTRARTTLYDEDFINDDSDYSDRPKRKKNRGWGADLESGESDNSWRQRKKRSRTIPSKPRSLPKSKSKKKKKRKRIIEDSDAQSDNEEEEEIRANNVDVVNSNKVPEDQINQVDKNVVESEEEVTVKAAQDIAEIEHVAEVDVIPVPEPGISAEPALPETKEIPQENIISSEVEKRLEELEKEVVFSPVEDQSKKRKKEIVPKQKKIRRKIIYGGLPDENALQDEENLGRRTRGRKINYQEVMASDSEEELKKALRKTEESEDEFVVNENEEVNEDAENDSGDTYSPKKDGIKPKLKSPKIRKQSKSKSPAGKKKMSDDDGTPKPRKKPGPKPGSKNKPRTPKLALTPLMRPMDDEEMLKGVDVAAMANPMDMAMQKVDGGVSMHGSTISASGSVTGEVAEGSLTGLGPGELAELDDEQLEQMMMEDEEYGRRQLELAAIEIAKKKKKEEREAKKLEKARLKALEILAAERERENAPEGFDGEAPKKKKRGRRSKAEIIAEQMRRDGASDLGLPGITPIGAPDMAPGVSSNLTSPMSSIITSENEGQLPMLHGSEGQLFSPEGSPMKPKRRGRGKGKKTLALEAARAAEAAAKAAAEAGIIGMGTDSNPASKFDDIPNVLPTPGSSTSGSAPSTPPASGPGIQGSSPSTQSSNSQVYSQQSLPPSQQSSVITRMLQSQPVAGSPQSFTAAAAAMGHKYFGGPNPAGPMIGGPRPGYEIQPRGRIPSPYRQPGQPSIPPHFAAVRSGTPPMRLRVPGPQMYHTSHLPMDPSPSGGGPISINNRDRSSPLGHGPAMIPSTAGSPLAKGGPTPPPPPYVRGPLMSRFPENPQLGVRHQIPPFSSASPGTHSLQQPSPPPSRPPGNFSPYHPPPPPNYHYGAYPPPPPMTTADDAAAYQGSPYPAEHFSTSAENQANIQAPTAAQTQQPHPQHNPNDEEGSGEFGGLVSYFSSQREDDLES